MNSIAQQAVPKGMGQSEFLRAQLASSLILVVRMLSPSAVSMPIVHPFTCQSAHHPNFVCREAKCQDLMKDLAPIDNVTPGQGARQTGSRRAQCEPANDAA